MTHHAIKRAEEREGVRLSAHDIAAMIAAIQDGNASISGLPNGNRPFCVQAVVRLHGRRYRVIYETKERVILTVLPIKGHPKQAPKSVWRRGRRLSV